MIIYVSLLICILGLLVYLVASNPKIAELGRLAFGAGLLAFLLGLPGSVVHLLSNH